jgi:hypothetical protein
LNEVWRRLQRDLVKLSPNSIQLISHKSEHDIAVDEPELVVKGIRLVFNAYRSGEPLAAPGK